MTKVELKCLGCNFRVVWYSSMWHEVMRYQLDDNYLCVDCSREIEKKAVADWYGARKQAGEYAHDTFEKEILQEAKKELGKE